MNSRAIRSSRRRGFTLLETLVVLAIMSVLLLLTMPSFMSMLRREKLIGAAREAANLLRMARSEAVKSQIPTGVKQDFASNQLWVFQDSNRDGVYDSTPAPADVLRMRQPLPSTIEMLGPGDTLATRTHASLGFGEASSASATEGTVIFDALGGANFTGSFRFSDAAGKNFIEVRVEPAASGRVFLRKWVSGAAEVLTNWKEQDQGGAVWAWK